MRPISGRSPSPTISGGRALVAHVGLDGDTTRPDGVPATDKLVSVDVASLRLNFWYDPTTFVVHHARDSGAKGGVRAHGHHTERAQQHPMPAVALSPMPTPFPHFTSRDVDVHLIGFGVTLAGTLTVPDGAARRRPAIVLVHGSGPEDRDEAIGPNAVFLQVSNALSNSRATSCCDTTNAVSAKAAARRTAVRARNCSTIFAPPLQLRARATGGRSERVCSLLGHSEGGELVPSVAARDPRVSPGIILMAPPALPLWQVIMGQALAGVPAIAAGGHAPPRTNGGRLQKCAAPTIPKTC